MTIVKIHWRGGMGRKKITGVPFESCGGTVRRQNDDTITVLGRARLYRTQPGGAFTRVIHHLPTYQPTYLAAGSHIYQAFLQNSPLWPTNRPSERNNRDWKERGKCQPASLLYIFTNLWDFIEKHRLSEDSWLPIPFSKNK